MSETGATIQLVSGTTEADALSDLGRCHPERLVVSDDEGEDAVQHEE